MGRQRRERKTFHTVRKMIQSETKGTTKQKEKDDNKKELGQRLEADIKT